MALTSTQLNEVAAITTQHINDEVPDLFVQANALYTKMYERKQYVSGGTFIQMPIATGDNDICEKCREHGKQGSAHQHKQNPQDFS